MLGNLAYRAARGQWRMYRKSRSAPGGPWTVTAVLFTALPFTVLAMCAAAAQRSASFWAWLAVNAVLVTATVASSGLVWRRRTLRRYAAATARKTVSPADAWRERAALLRELEELTAQALAKERAAAQPPEVPEPAPPRSPERERVTEALLSMPCPVPSCLAPPAVACPMMAAVPVTLVRWPPPDPFFEFCHHARMRDAVAAGAVAREDVLAQFRDNVPAELL